MQYSVIINPNSNSAKEVIDFFRNRSLSYSVSRSKPDLQRILDLQVKKKVYNFIICGGDGTINNFVNSYLGLPVSVRKKITVGLLPCGKANDLIRVLGMPLSINLAYQRILRGNARPIDLVRMNKHAFVTGGGIGLPSEVVQEVDRFSKKHKLISKNLRDLIYYVFVLKKVIFGYTGVGQEKNNKLFRNHMLISVLNQPFIGKRFNLAPSAKNDDGKLELVYIRKPKGALRTFFAVQQITKGIHQQHQGTLIKKVRKARFSFEKPYAFMADGEILETNTHFEIEVLPKSLNVFV